MGHRSSSRSAGTISVSCSAPVWCSWRPAVFVPSMSSSLRTRKHRLFVCEALSGIFVTYGADGCLSEPIGDLLTIALSFVSCTSTIGLRRHSNPSQSSWLQFLSPVPFKTYLITDYLQQAAFSKPHKTCLFPKKWLSNQSHPLWPPLLPCFTQRLLPSHRRPGLLKFLTVIFKPKREKS